MDDACTIEHNVDSPDLGNQSLDRRRRKHVEHPRFDTRNVIEFTQKLLVDVGGKNARACCGEGQRRGPSDSLRRRRDKTDLSRNIGHAALHFMILPPPTVTIRPW